MVGAEDQRRAHRIAQAVHSEDFVPKVHAALEGGEDLNVGQVVETTEANVMGMILFCILPHHPLKRFF